MNLLVCLLVFYSYKQSRGCYCECCIPSRLTDYLATLIQLSTRASDLVQIQKTIIQFLDNVLV